MFAAQPPTPAWCHSDRASQGHLSTLKVTVATGSFKLRLVLWAVTAGLLPATYTGLLVTIGEGVEQPGAEYCSAMFRSCCTHSPLATAHAKAKPPCQHLIEAFARTLSPPRPTVQYLPPWVAWISGTFWSEGAQGLLLASFTAPASRE